MRFWKLLGYRPLVRYLVLKDLTHMTRSFARTLAPAVMAQLRGLMQGWPEAQR